MVKVRKTIEASMYYGASPLIIKRAKELRKTQTPAEVRLWQVLEAKQIYGLHFRRQHPIGNFIVDFYCHSTKLVIIIDGKIHNNEEVEENDENRSAELGRFGISVIRFSNSEVFKELSKVRRIIMAICEKMVSEI